VLALFKTNQTKTRSQENKNKALPNLNKPSHTQQAFKLAFSSCHFSLPYWNHTMTNKWMLTGGGTLLLVAVGSTFNNFWLSGFKVGACHVASKSCLLWVSALARS
jgi:hypothetical protein